MRIRCSRRLSLRWVVIRAWLNANDVTKVRRRMGGIEDGANQRGRGFGVKLVDMVASRFDAASNDSYKIGAFKVVEM